MKNFKKIMAVVLAGGFLFGFSAVTLAYDVPGWDIPYNPPAYYSPDTPDPEDSPSPFFFFDLADQGMEVYDPTREKQKIEKVKNWQAILDIMLQKLDINQVNIRMLSSDNLRDILANAFGINNEIYNKNQVIPMMNAVTEGTTLRATERYDEYQREYSTPDALKLNQAAVQNAASFTEAVLDDSKKGQIRSERLQQDMYRAEGIDEQLQILNYWRYQNFTEKYRKLEISSNKLALKAQEFFSDINDDIAEARNHNVVFMSVDPTNMDDYQKEHYKPRNPLGFPEFK